MEQHAKGHCSWIMFLDGLDSLLMRRQPLQIIKSCLILEKFHLLHLFVNLDLVVDFSDLRVMEPGA